MNHAKTGGCFAVMLVLTVFFTGCVSSESNVDAIEQTAVNEASTLLQVLFTGSENNVTATEQAAKEINELSTLPMNLLSPKSNADESGYTEYIPNFMSFDYYGKDFIISFFGFPTDEDDFFLTDISWMGPEYDLFGIKIGDEHALAAEILKSFGYLPTDEKYMRGFVKDDIFIRLSGEQVVKEIAIHIPSKYTSGNLY